MNALKRFHEDARNYQILILIQLFLYQLFFSSFGSNIFTLLLTIVASCGSQYLFLKAYNSDYVDLKSSVITAFSITILLNANFLWAYILVAVLATASKFIVRVNNSHMFNPSNIAIVCVLLLLPQYIWLSPGQWGNAVWFGFVVSLLAGIVLGKAMRIDTAVFFLVSYSLLIFGRAMWLGDPFVIPVHQLQSGALLIFAFFMITDPKATPESRRSRFLFTFFVALLGFTLQFSFQIREGLFYALAIVSGVRFLILYFENWKNSHLL